MLSWERRHLPDELWYHRRETGGEGPGQPPQEILLLESDLTGFEGLLLESDTGTGTDFLQLESAP
ncbi:MAG: hypothetical protein J2P41_00220 [Blastocatellia bacterium]|nr:hypothetical protein [Blastocatellia bacterium]